MFLIDNGLAIYLTGKGRSGFENFARFSRSPDYTDLVQIATVHIHKNTEHPFSLIEMIDLPAFSQLGLARAGDQLDVQMDEAKSMLY